MTNHPFAICGSAGYFFAVLVALPDLLPHHFNNRAQELEAEELLLGQCSHLVLSNCPLVRTARHIMNGGKGKHPSANAEMHQAALHTLLQSVVKNAQRDVEHGPTRLQAAENKALERALTAFCESASLSLKKKEVTCSHLWMKLGDLKEPQSADGRSLIIAVDMSCQHQEIFLLVYPKGWAKQRVVGPGDVHIVSRFHRVSTSSGTEKPLAIRLRGTCSLLEGHRQYELVLLNPDGL